MADNLMLLSRTPVSVSSKGVKTPISRCSDFYAGNLLSTPSSLQVLRDTLFVILGITPDVHYEHEHNACYQIKNGFFLSYADIHYIACREFKGGISSSSLRARICAPKIISRY
ncbi:TPA: hypothetical protein ACH1J3_002891 [Citrobacter werkmanii]